MNTEHPDDVLWLLAVTGEPILVIKAIREITRWRLRETHRVVTGPLPVGLLPRRAVNHAPAVEELARLARIEWRPPQAPDHDYQWSPDGPECGICGAEQKDHRQPDPEV